MKTFLRTYFPSLSAGALLAFAFPKLSLFWLAWVALVPLFVSAAKVGPRAAAGRFFVAGWLFHSMVLYWLMSNVYWAGGWAFVGYQILCGIMGGYWALCGLGWAWTRKRVPWLGGAWALAALWTAMESLQARLFSGFGWSAIGYCQGPDAWLLQNASLGGVCLLTFLVALVNALVALAWADRASAGKARSLGRLASAVAVVAVAHLSGWLLLQPSEKDSGYRVGLLQTNYSLEMKWDPEYLDDMVYRACDKSAALATDRGPLKLMVWPETMVMADIDRPVLREPINQLVGQMQCPLFTGSHRDQEGTGAALNSCYLIGVDGQSQGYYDKVHLAPFGEYVPFSKWLPFVQHIVPAIGDIQFGQEQKVFPAGERTFGPLICFEVLFGDLAEGLRARGAQYLVVITNLGWFGESSAILQEFELARVRAVETRLPVVHCANTGVSGVFDPYGRFEIANAWFDDTGRCRAPRGDLGPDDIIGKRLGGAFELPKAVAHPFAPGRRIFECAAGVASAIVLALAAFLPRKAKAP